MGLVVTSGGGSPVYGPAGVVAGSAGYVGVSVGVDAGVSAAELSGGEDVPLSCADPVGVAVAVPGSAEQVDGGVAG